jgi:HAE1 family hydrophobic/amphiphilic exporter-1
MNKRSLFDRRRGEGRNIDVEITGPELGELIARGSRIFGEAMRKLPDAQVRPIPSLDLGNPEVRVRTHRRRAAELGLSNRELGYAVSALVDGAKASDYLWNGKEIDIRLMAEESDLRRTHLLEQLPIATPDGSLVTLGSVADVDVVTGPVQINHAERQRTIAVRVIPSEEMPVEAAMEIIAAEIIEPMRAAGRFDGIYRAHLGGTGEDLVRTWRSVRWDLLLALVITFLLLAALFESFLYPFVIMFSVPLAAFGGFLGLRVTAEAAGQKLDVLTMLGFVILIGTVVNNAILIVHQSLNLMRGGGAPHREAIRDSVRTRMRPIFMSVSTSVLGMLPLVLFPGAGAELYRGLGSVVIGGLLVSTLFTLIVVPALFSLALDARTALLTRLGRRPDPQPTT